MGIIQTVSNWFEASRQKNIEKMREQGRCPECRGSGLHSMAFNNDFLVGPLDQYDCPGCSGSGRFDDWAAQQSGQPSPYPDEE